MKKSALLFLLGLALSCQNNEHIIYQNDSYALYSDKVIQGEYLATVESPERIVSNYGGDTLVWEKKNDHAGFPKLSTPYPVEEAVYR